MKRLGQSALGTGAGTLVYTVPTGFRTDVMDMFIANTTAGSLACSVHFTPSGTAVGASNAIFSSVAIPANTTVHWSGIQTLSVGGFIQGIGSGSGLTLTVTGEEMRAGT